MFGIDLVFYIAGAIAWITGGSITARHEHIERQKEWLAIADDETARQERIEEIKNELRTMNHGICNMNYSSMKSRGCDCSKRNKWRRLHEELDELQAGGPVKSKPGAPYHVLLGWPVYAFHNFITPEIKPEPVKAVEAADFEEAEPLIDMTQSYNPYRVFEDDPWGKELKEGRERIKQMAEEDLAKARKNDPEAYKVETEGETVRIFNGKGVLLKEHDALVF